MKKWFLLVLTLVFVFVISGCSTSDRTETASEQTESVTESERSDTDGLPKNKYNSESSSENESKSSVLVVYFSRTGEQYGVGEIDKGNTAIVAEMIADKTEADMFEILPVDDHYPMTYDALTDVAKQEQSDNARPEYSGGVPDLSQYDTVFMGAPVWWGDWPMIMYTFFENEDLSGKTLVPFSTHAGSGISGFDSKLSAACPASNVLDGLAVTGADAQNNPDSVKGIVEEWLSNMGY